VLFGDFKLGWRYGRISGIFVEELADAEDGVSSSLLLSYVELVLQAVDGRVLLCSWVRHVGECTGGLCGLPTDAVEADDAKVHGHVLVFECGVFHQLLENDDIIIKFGLSLMDVGLDFSEIICVGLNLAVKTDFCFVNEMAVVLPLDAAFEAKCDEEADGDGGEMKEEVAPAVDGLVGGARRSREEPLLDSLRVSVTNSDGVFICEQ
jgi:hypothetical protein